MVIAKDVGFQISQEQTHVLLPPTLQFSHCQVDGVLSINGVCTLVNVVIMTLVKLIWFHKLLFLVGLLRQLQLKQRMIFIIIDFQQICFSFNSRGFQVSTPIGGWVFSLMCEHDGAKGVEGPPLSILHTLYKQRVPMMLQHV
jgi:hypothetical protein